MKKTKVLTPKEINRNFRKFQRDLKSTFDPIPASAHHRDHQPTAIIPAKVKAEKRLELKIAIANGDLNLVEKLLKEFPEMINKVENLLCGSFVLKYIFQTLDEVGSVPLIVATRTNQLLILNFLLQISVIDVNARSKVEGLLVFIVLSSRSHFEILNMFRKIILR
jgi:hypothetical protein